MNSSLSLWERAGVRANSTGHVKPRSSTRMDEVLAKRAKLFDAMAARAEVRRVRALKLGNVREAEGAKMTIADVAGTSGDHRQFVDELESEQQ